MHKRSPRWGRGQETPGEGALHHNFNDLHCRCSQRWCDFLVAVSDPTLTSSYAAHFVGGMQGNDSTYLKVAATLKHFAAYSQETGRVNDPVVVTNQDMVDTYLPAFEAGVKKGFASGLMCSVCPRASLGWVAQ